MQAFAEILEDVAKGWITSTRAQCPKILLHTSISLKSLPVC